MSEAITVRGPVDTANLGFTSMHEHVLCNGSFYADVYEPLLPDPDPRLFPTQPDEPVRMENLAYLRHAGFINSMDDWNLTDEDLMTLEVADFRQAGGGTMVEVSAPGLRGDVEGLRRISEQADVHIIASTGLYAEASWPAKFRNMSVGELTDHMIGEIEDGIEGTSIRAGHIKTASNDYSDAEQRAMRAGARASLATGRSMTVHPGMAVDETTHRKMAETLLNEGADPNRMVLCHMQSYVGTTDIEILVRDPDAWKPRFDYLIGLAEQGFVLSIDTFGMLWDSEPLGETGGNDVRKLAAMVALCDAGFSDQVVVGCDVFLKTMTRRYGSDGYARLLNFVAPWLDKLGVSTEDVRKIFYDTPAKLLGRTE